MKTQPPHNPLNPSSLSYASRHSDSLVASRRVTFSPSRRLEGQIWVTVASSDYGISSKKNQDEVTVGLTYKHSFLRSKNLYPVFIELVWYEN
jgi:hypothetical protein